MINYKHYQNLNSILWDQILSYNFKLEIWVFWIYWIFLFLFIKFIEVQPNDGFGTLLPQETLEIDLIFSAKIAKDYNFQLSCKSGINRLVCVSVRK